MSATTATAGTTTSQRKHTPLTYNILTNAYARLMNTDKDKWDLYMKLQQQDLQQEYAFYREIGKLIMRIAKRPHTREFYRPVFGNKTLINNVAAEYRKYAAAVRAHFKDPAQFPMPAPYRMPEPEEDRWELVIETDLRDQDLALEGLRMRWMDNPAATAQHIVEFLADYPIYRTDDEHFRTEIVRSILRQATRQLATQQPIAFDWKAYEELHKAQKDPEKARKAKPQMRQIRMLPKPGDPFSVEVPNNLTLMESDFDLYRRHETWVYVAGDDGKLVGLNLPLDNNFARLKSNNRTYNAGKYNVRYEEQLADISNPESPTQKSLRFLAHQVAEGRKVKIVTDRSAAHGHMVIQAVATLVPEEEAKLHKAARRATRMSGTHNMDDRDYTDEYDRPARHVWKSRQYQHDYWLLRAQALHEAEGPVTVPDQTADFVNAYWARRKEVLGKAEGPVKLPTLPITKKDALEVKWWNLYWMPRRYITYLVLSVRRFYDRNGIKKHVVVYRPVKIIKQTTDEEGQAKNVIRRNKAGWAIVDDADLRQLCHADHQLPQYDWDGEITGYSNYRQAPPAFRGELPEKFTTPLTAEEIKTLGRDNIRPIREYGRTVGWTRKPKPWDYNSKIRNSFALALAIVRSNPTFRRTMETISRWEYEKNHRFEHKTLKNATQDPKGSKNYHEDEGELSNGRFDSNDALLEATYEEFAEATMYAQGARDGLDLLVDGEISLATAAELASLESKLTRRQQESTVADVLDQQLRKLQENDQKKDDLRRAEQIVDILTMLKRHPELEAHMSRELNAGTRLCKIWNIALPKSAGYVHTPLSQMFHLRPITVRKDGVNLTPEEQMALPENEGRRYIAAEWEAQAPEELFMQYKPNPWENLPVRNGKRIYQLKRKYGELRLTLRGQHTRRHPTIYRKAA